LSPNSHAVGLADVQKRVRDAEPDRSSSPLALAGEPHRGAPRFRSA
jgi:hypothetical protein